MMWLKALHIISMVTWFAGLFYLPRLFVYHAMSEDQASIDRFKIMERKLYAGIMTPSMIATLLFGLWMLWDYAWAAYGNMGWLHVKLCLVGILVIYHLWCGRLLKTFKNDQNQRSHVWYRWFNEAPVIVLIAIVLLASLKPF
ncbi:MAG: protoporphyrinogen oxidase HemJ [Candidatus Competibacteraceae bacterium]|nr:protoporphyrinogen oxidase HemJ [Candidatus Competibacteraceae bacterium]